MAMLLLSVSQTYCKLAKSEVKHLGIKAGPQMHNGDVFLQFYSHIKSLCALSLNV